MDIKDFFQSKQFKILVGTVAGLVVLLLVFKAGMLVGYKKAGFSFRWADNYHKNFGGPMRGAMPGMPRGFGDREFMGANGTFGQIIKTDGQTLVVKGVSDQEKIIVIGDKTSIMRFREKIKPADLKAGEDIVVIGEPNNTGQIEAKLIRVMPSKQLDEKFQNIGTSTQNNAEIKATSTESNPENK